MANASVAAETRKAAGWWRMVEALRALDDGYFELSPDVTPNEIRSAGGGTPALANQFGQYLAVRKLGTDRLASLVRYQLWDDRRHAPVAVVNEPAHVLLTRTLRTRTEFKLGSKSSGWVGLHLTHTQRARLVAGLHEASMASRNAVTAKTLYRLARDFEILSEGSGLIIARQLSPVRNVIAHEQTHEWQNQHPYDSTIARKVSKSRIYGRAVSTLLERGYGQEFAADYLRTRDPDIGATLGLIMWREIGAHLAGGDDLQVGPPGYVYSLICRYFEAYSVEALRTIPSDSAAVRAALRWRGVERRKAPVFDVVAARPAPRSRRAAY